MGITQRTPLRQLRRLADNTRRHGPLGGIRNETQAARKRFGHHRALGLVVSTADRSVRRVQAALDRGFDRQYGTDTSGVLSLDELAIADKNEDGGYHWYEAVSRKRFSMMMAGLGLTDEEKQSLVFVDLGSGKGRAVLMAAEHGFPYAIGVEFSETLVDSSIENTEAFLRTSGASTEISHVCSDAALYELPDAPLLIFFYSPFSGVVLERVIENIRSSYESSPRPIVLLFYGQNPVSIAMFDSLGFERTELALARDLTQFGNYDTLVYWTPEALPMLKGTRSVASR